VFAISGNDGVRRSAARQRRDGFNECTRFLGYHPVSFSLCGGAGSKRANGGVMMHVADNPALYELRPKGDVPFHHVSTIAVSLRHARKRGV
jgi:hypothetical protein